jgi:endonuclease YncB( thermonuclease family)
LRLWRNYTPAAVVSGGAGSASQFNAKVVEIGLGDSLTVIKDGQTQSMKIHLSSIRAPKTGDGMTRLVQK